MLKKTFTLRVDEDRADVISAMLIHCFEDEEFIASLGGDGRLKDLLPSFQDLLLEVSEQVHAAGWCNDEDCPANKEQHNFKIIKK